MYFRVNLKMKKPTLCCFTWIVFIELNFTGAFLLIRKTWDARFVDKVRGPTPMYSHCFDQRMFIFIFRIFWAMGRFGEIGPKQYPNHGQGYTTPCFTSNETLLKKKSHLRVNLKKLGPNRTSNHVQRYKLSQSVHLQIPHQVRLTQTVKLSEFLVFGQFEEIWSKYIKSWVGIHMKIHKLVSA